MASALLVLAAGLFGVPRIWLHHCDQAGVDHHHPDSAAIYADLDCEICSALITVFDADAERVPLPVDDAPARPFLERQLMLVARALDAPASRGPPMT